MEFHSILHFLENKSILLTGASGFLAKVFIEKVMRVQPNVKKLHLLLRAADSTSALHRFNTEVMGNELFKVVREKYGAKLNSFIQEKVMVVSGDVTCDCLGLESSTSKKLFEEVNVVINCAATTNFDERYDIALEINTIGAANVLSFVTKCSQLSVFLHVSTAYVFGEKDGLILETPLKLGDTLNETLGLKIETEKIIIDNKLKQLHNDGASEKEITSTMKDLGCKRARKYGWPNTYSFTKAIGEMLLGHFKNNIPLVIIRPAVITSTFKEPFPGWTEGVRHIDSFVVGYGKGKLSCFPGDPQAIMDLIPADMVVNAMIASMAAHGGEAAQTIYHVGSSMSNPVVYQRLQDCGLRFFTEQPWIGNDGKPVVVRRGTQLPTKVAVRRYMELHYLIPLKILSLVNAASCGYFQGTYLDLSRKVAFLMRLVQLFSPYVFFKGVFDDTNTEKLRRAIKERCGSDEDEIFYFDPKTINWDDYFPNTHIAGVVKYAFRR
ncbi:fatty acyl-CoA reductase 3-like [Salvia miltiorrhiza]|uniref:fatty acyl-CoA reductase 3-like n=1 Tax=Salvia miltiorrhiza TaxID=226208 RepID=UPI0025AD431B|nr:fatty acyl-CoA reductase 3-like [Salvia miltiorrhiza]